MMTLGALIVCQRWARRAAKNNRAASPCAKTSQLTVIQPVSCAGFEELPNRRRFLRVWPVPLVTWTVLFSLITLWLVRDLFVDRSPGDAPGGILLMLETEQFAPEVEVHASLRDTGPEGFDLLRLQIEASEAIPANTRWYVYASGQYRPPPSAPDLLFCSSSARVVRERGLVRCSGDRGLGATRDVEYRRSEILGTASAGEVTGLVDHNAYDEDNVTTITGVFEPDDSDRGWIVWIPITDVRLGRSGLERQGLLAPIAVGDIEFGASAREFEGLQVTSEDALYVSTSTGQELELANLTSFKLEASHLLGAKRLVWSDPPTTVSDQLQWDTRDLAFRFAMLDATSQGAFAGRVFLGGVSASVAAAGIFLLLEKSLERRISR